MTNYKEYLRAFVIGSSMLVFLPFIYSVSKMDNMTKNYSYTAYSFIAPLYFGILNMISLYIAKQYNLDSKYRYLIIGIISPIIVMSFSTFTNSYNYDKKQWINYYIYLFIKHFLTYNITIYLLNEYI